MQKNNFYEFTRPVQERFIGSVNGTGMPTPLLERRGGPSLPLPWLGLSAFGVVLLIALFPVGLGVLESRLAIQSVLFLVLDVGGVAAIVMGVMKVVSAMREVKALPFRPGIYVFPIGLVDAREYVLKVYPLAEISGVEQTASEVVLTAEGARFAFPQASPEEVSAGAARFAEAQKHLSQAMSTRESLRPGALAGIDPFHGAASPFVPNKPLLREVPLWAKVPWAFALGAGVVVGLFVWMIRNNVGDRRLYAAALERNDVEAYEAYLARGTKYKDEVKRVRLPRAELRLAEKAGTVDAIEEYIKTHPGAAIPDEVQAARRVALLKALDKAREAGTVTSLKDFDQRHPRHGLDGELKKAIHQVYVNALEKYRSQAAPKDPDTLRFVEQLILLAEQKGPDVRIRFRHKASKTLDKADGLVTKNKFFNGTQSFPSRHFDGARLASRDTELLGAVAQRFADVFPKDVLFLQAGEAIKEEGPLPAFPVPTLVVEHQVEWAGGVVTSTNPRGVFIGAGLLFEATFRLPGDTAKPLKTKLADWRAPDVTNLKGEGKPEEKLYDQMAKNCFDNFTKRLLGMLFRPVATTAK